MICAVMSAVIERHILIDFYAKFVFCCRAAQLLSTFPEATKPEVLRQFVKPASLHFARTALGCRLFLGLFLYPADLVDNLFSRRLMPIFKKLKVGKCAYHLIKNKH